MSPAGMVCIALALALLHAATGHAGSERPAGAAGYAAYNAQRH